jgi:hypothetical protein
MALASDDQYSKGESDYSVTEILSPPRINRLRKRHYTELTSDVSEMIWMLLGTALHVVAERSVVDGHTNEERLFLTIDDIILSGAIDLQRNDHDGTVITDYKFTSAWSLMNDKPEWIQQQNIYRYIYEKVKKTPVKGLQICAFIRDFSRRKAQSDSSYPQATIQVIEIPMWTMDETEAYIKARIEMHRESKVNADWDEELPLCSEEERWMRDTTYAVKKEGRKTAIRVFDTDVEAQELLATMTAKDKAFVEVRKGEAVRCTGNYCGVSKWCSQFQSTQEDSF